MYFQVFSLLVVNGPEHPESSDSAESAPLARPGIGLTVNHISASDCKSTTRPGSAGHSYWVVKPSPNRGSNSGATLKTDDYSTLFNCRLRTCDWGHTACRPEAWPAIRAKFAPAWTRICADIARCAIWMSDGSQSRQPRAVMRGGAQRGNGETRAGVGDCGEARGRIS